MSDNLIDLFDAQGLKTPFNTPQSTSPEPSDEYSYQGDLAPTIEDAERIAQSKYNVSNHNALMGTLVSAGVEIGGGIGGTVYATKIMKGMKYANRAKNVALAGVVAPEPVSTITGAIAFGATEAAIWGFSNFLGQTARKQFGIQDHYSGGEMIAAAVFGTAAATAQTTRLIELAPSLASMKAWKSMPIARETGKAFVTGAGLGVAESLLRQEVQLILNERENRDVMDYMFSGAAGGGFNTVFSVFGRTGAWGLTKAGDASQNARHLAEQKLEQARNITNKRKREKEVNKWTEAITHLEEVETSFRGAAQAERDYHSNAPEPEQVNNPSGDPRQAPKLDPLDKPDTPSTPKETPEGEAPETPKDAPEAEVPETPAYDTLSYKELQTEAKKQGIKANQKKQTLLDELTAKKEEPDAPKVPEEETINTPEEEGAPAPDPDEPKLTERQTLIESYKERFKGIKGEGDLAKKFASLQVDTNKLKTEMDADFQWRIEDLTAKYQAGEELSSLEMDEMLELVNDLRSLNEVDNVLKTTAGRGMQANRSDAEKYVSSTDLSLRAIREDAALFDMEETLKQLQMGKDVPSMEKQFEDFLNTKDTTNKLNAAIYGNQKLSEKELDELGITQDELDIQRRTATLIQVGIKTLTRQLEKERAKMMKGMNLALNKQQKDKLAEEVNKRMKENPSIRMMEEQLKYYKKAEREGTLLQKERKELARLAGIYGEGNMTQLRKEVEVKARVAKAETELSKIRKKQAMLNKEIRNKVKEIDGVNDSPEISIEKRIDKLNKRLQKLREVRSGLRAPDAKKKQAPKTDEELKIEETIKFYENEAREITQLAKKDKELARLIKLETEGTLGQIRAEFTIKPALLDEARGKLAEADKKISDTKSRMRSTVKDVDRAKAEMDKFDLFLSMQSYAMRNIEADASNKFVQFGRDIRAARRLALIDQIPSIMAGVPTGVGLALRSAVRPFAMAPLDFARYGGDTAFQLMKAEFKGVATAIMNWNGTATSMGRTFQRGSSATDQVMSKYLEESTHKAIRMGNAPSIDRAMKTAEARLKQQKDPMNTILDFRNNAGWSLLSLGVRGIGAIDDGFRRQILRGRLETAARRKAIMEHPTDPKLAEEMYNNYMKTMWKDQNGLQVLSNYKEFIDEVNDINQNLLFAAQHDNPDLFHKNMGEQLISALGDAAKGDTGLAFLVDAFMPYISVPLRGVYRGARFAAAPAVGISAHSPLNPYTRKIKERAQTIETAQFGMLKLDEADPQFKQFADDIKNAQTETAILKEREIKYKEDAMVDTLFGGGLFALGMLTAAVGETTGSLNWMSRDQQEKNKLKPFQMFGMDYSAAAPWSIPIAIGADLFQYIKARDAGVLDEKQNMFFMLGTSLVTLSEQVPMMQGFETFNSIISGGMQTRAKLVGRLAAGYVPLPAQVRKTLMASTEDGTIGDLRGGTFGQRTAYAFFGWKPVNRKTDYFGDDIDSGKSWIQHAVIRQYPSKDQGLQTDFDYVLASDAFDNIQPIPSSLGNRLKMTSFIDDEGITLQYAYALRLRDHRKVYKGKKRTLKEAVNKLISSNKWRKKHETATISDSLQHTNEGLRELNKLMQDYYFEVRESIINDDDFTKRFVNNRDEYLYDLVRRRDTEILGNTRPIRELLQSF